EDVEVLRIPHDARVRGECVGTAHHELYGRFSERLQSLYVDTALLCVEAVTGARGDRQSTTRSRTCRRRGGWPRPELLPKLAPDSPDTPSSSPSTTSQS